MSAAIVSAPQVWVREGWYKRFGLSEEGTGLGHTPEQVAAFRVKREALFGYLDAAHHETINRVASLTPAQIGQTVEYPPGASRPVWQALAGMSGDSYQHAGQIAYLRGLMTGHGWRERVGMS